MCLMLQCKRDNAFKYPLIGVSFYLNPEHTAEYITRTLQKAVSDYDKEPNNLSFMFVWPDWKSAPWHELLGQLLLAKTYLIGSHIVSFPASNTFDAQTLAGFEVGGHQFAYMHFCDRAWHLCLCASRSIQTFVPCSGSNTETIFKFQLFHAASSDITGPLLEVTC